ncbi:hypothetical protein VTI28DRAFT_1950 [Corynascus sepedonium]
MARLPAEGTAFPFNLQYHSSSEGKGGALGLEISIALTPQPPERHRLEKHGCDASIALRVVVMFKSVIQYLNYFMIYEPDLATLDKPSSVSNTDTFPHHQANPATRTSAQEKPLLP